MRNATEAVAGPEPMEQLANLLHGRRLLVLTGAGCSTDSGIPDYRDADASWKRKPPIQFSEFRASLAARRRYWARSLLGWPQIAAARPNPSHRILAEWEAQGHLTGLITQNVDGLHQRAGSRQVIDLHGRLDVVDCLDCGRRLERSQLQEELLALNPGWQSLSGPLAPDGDVDLEAVDFSHFRLRDCSACGGLLKPAVVFFGEQVPQPRVAQAMDWLAAAEALLVLGSSLMVWSGYRFVRAALQQGLPVAAINLGRTRADGELTLKLEQPCAGALARLSEQFRR
jgi:NAD-dependent SIR2 family protein deacetylase